MPDPTYHDPNRHDSMTLVLTAITAFFVGLIIGCTGAYYALT